MNSKGITTQIEYNKKIIQNHIEAYYNKRLTEDKKVRMRIYKEKSYRRDRDL